MLKTNTQPAFATAFPIRWTRRFSGRDLDQGSALSSSGEWPSNLDRGMLCIYAASTQSCLEAHMIRSVFVVSVTSIAILCGQHGAGAQARCPLSTMDACDRWHLEQIDQQLAQVV